MLLSVIRGGRRRRYTVAKWLLVAVALLGVVYWFRQTKRNDLWNDGLSSEVSKAEQNIVVPSSILQKENKRVIVKLHPPTADGKLKETGKSIRIINRGGDQLADKGNSKEHQLLPPLDEKRVDFKPPFSFKDVFKNAGDGQIAAPFKDVKSNKRTTTSTTKLPYLKSQKDKFMHVTPGLGENGAPVLLSREEQERADAVFNEAAFNVYISDRISLNRTVPDVRHELCHNERYEPDLPSTSVIIIFYNEVWSALLRTVHSVVNRTPSHLLKEIILVDDASTRGQ